MHSHTHTTLHCSTLRCPTFRLHNKIHCIALYYTTLHCIHTYYANKMCCLHIIESYIITYVHVHTYEWPLAILAKMQSMRLTAPVLSTCIKLWVWFARRAHWIIIGSAWMDWWPTVQSHLMALHEHCQSQQGHVQFARYFEVSCSSFEEVIKESHIHTICSPYFTMRFRWALEGQTLNDTKCIWTPFNAT